MTGGVLVVGASQAGVQLGASLREHGYDGPVTLVGAEPQPPYQRPPLSKAYLGGAADSASLELRDQAFYANRRIDLLPAERVTHIGRGTALTDQGRVLDFDHLALTVGARARRLTVPGSDLTGVCYLRDLADAALLRRHLTRARHVVVVGGGFIGLEVAAVARSDGRSVTVVEAAPRLMARAVAPTVSEFYRHAHARRGTEVLLGAQLTRIDGEHGRVAGVSLADGTRLPADLVVAGVGVVPRTELAEQLGLACDGGIVVDEFARTSDPSIVAAGDCTVMPNPVTGEGRVRLESMPNAIAQARVAAATLIGKARPYADVPWFWSDQYDLKLQIAGVADGYDQVVVRGEPESEAFSALYYRGGELLAVNAVNRTADYLVVRKALASRTPLPADRAAHADVPLKDLLVATPAP
ncbi:ferredoxin [Sphaerisporangium album]|uniref:Ferredoxin n=1 Tax=Sphaerisporangium album TaxID=509200 RepID=A0A367FL90_9ACTN|nr:FAD-dependent oxidoreductase [Sphaerisporangium album]RCG30487.1 ferredoxin [Sphaerisporangium album]